MTEYNIAREVALIRLDNNNCRKYFMYCLLSKPFENFRDMRLSGSVYVGLNMETLSIYQTQYPPLAEQHDIATYLDTKCSEFDSIISDKQKQISTLEAYKKSLIYEYVTGKKEVE